MNTATLMQNPGAHGVTRPTWTEHPLVDRVDGGRYRKLSEEEFVEMAEAVGIEAALAYWQARETRIKLAESDPLLHGFELPHWAELREQILAKTETYILGANNSAKSFFAGKLTAEVMSGRFAWPGMHPGKIKVLMVAQDDDASKQFQQEPVFIHLPAAVKAYNAQGSKKRNGPYQVNYSEKGGFTEGTFVIKGAGRVAQCYFKTVAQYTRNEDSFEGPAYHLVIIDEGAPLKLLQLLAARAAKVGGKIVYLHTNVNGITPVAAALLEGARLLKSLPMNWDWSHRGDAETRSGEKHATIGGCNPDLVFPELSLTTPHDKGLRQCPTGHMPYLMQPLDFNKIIIFIWCHWNPFQPRGKWKGGQFPAMFDTCVGAPKWKVRVKLFGWIEKLAGAKIGNFDPNVHVIAHEKIEKLLLEKKLTTYCMADPHIARSYFIIWKGVDENGINYIFDECPNLDEGEWVDANGDEGEGARVYGSVGVNFYKQLIRDREKQHGVEATRRFGDPRAFATQSAAANGGTSLFELFLNEGEDLNRDGQDGQDNRASQQQRPTDFSPMFFEPARIRQTVDLDLEAMVTLFRYDSEKPISVENQPKLYVSDRCQNFIRALLNFDGKADSLFKDPVDAARYGFCEETPYLDEKVSEISGGGSWG